MKEFFYDSKTYLSNLFEINSCNCESDIPFFACAKVLASPPTVYLNNVSEEFEAFFIASTLVSVSALTIFTVFPTYVVRPFLSGTDLSTQLLNWIYSRDYMYNAFPSGHVYITTLIALFWSRWFPRWRWLWAATVVMVALATLFTHQHYLPDPIGGLVLAWFGYRIGLWCVADSLLTVRPTGGVTAY